MVLLSESFEFDYFGTNIVYGRGAVARIGDMLVDRGLESALVVCGSNVGANENVMEPLNHGLGDHLVETFAETTPEKRAATVFDGIDAMERTDADVLVGVGGGSSLDIARQMSVFEADARSLSDLETAAHEGDIQPPTPGNATTPVIVIPTTFAGADLSGGGSIQVLDAAESPTGQPIQASGTVMPEAVLYDPDLFDTTPTGALAGSAMNGFNKGIETAYANDASPITDATSVKGLRLLRESFIKLGEDRSAMDGAVQGTILVQFRRRGSVIHAFGHGFARHYPLQQGVVHGVMAPHVLQYVFDIVDGRREVIAAGLEVPVNGHTDEEIADRIVDSVTEVRDSLELPSRLRELNHVEQEDFHAIAEFVVEDPLMSRTPTGLDPTVKEIKSVLDAAW